MEKTLRELVCEAVCEQLGDHVVQVVEDRDSDPVEVYTVILTDLYPLPLEAGAKGLMIPYDFPEPWKEAVMNSAIEMTDALKP